VSKPSRSLFPFSYTQQRLHGLAGEAYPPPSGADHRGRPRLAPDLLGVCACFLSSCRARAHTKWCPVQQSRAHRRSSGEAPPRLPCLRCARQRPLHTRVQDCAIARERFRSKRGVPLRCGLLWTREPSSRRGARLHQPLDLRSMAQPSLFH
jgi:hypothetical protein